MFGLLKKKVVKETKEEPKEIVYVLTLYIKGLNRTIQWENKNKGQLVNGFVKWYHARPQSQTYFMKDTLGGYGIKRRNIICYSVRKTER